MKFFELFIRAIYWLQAFVAPVILFGIIGVIIYANNGRLFVIIVSLISGSIAGIFLAEFIRRKYGLENFFSKIYGSGSLGKKDQKTK